jgi:hypothetical protein
VILGINEEKITIFQWNILVTFNTVMASHSTLKILDLKRSPCTECCMLLLGDSLALEVYTPTFWNT